MVDGFVTFIEGDEKVIPNVADLTFAEHEGSFLVGVAAALKTEKKNVGFVGGTNGFLIQKFEAGFVAGVKEIDPSIKIEISTSHRTGKTKRASRTPLAVRPLRPVSTTTAPTSSTMLPESRVWASSTLLRPPERATGLSVSTPTSTSLSTKRRSRTS